MKLAEESKGEVCVCVCVCVCVRARVELKSSAAKLSWIGSVGVEAYAKFGRIESVSQKWPKENNLHFRSRGCVSTCLQVMILELAQHVQTFLRQYNAPPAQSFHEQMLTNQRRAEEKHAQEQMRKAELLKKKEEKQVRTSTQENCNKKAKFSFRCHGDVFGSCLQRQQIESEIEKRQMALREESRRRRVEARQVGWRWVGVGATGGGVGGVGWKVGWVLGGDAQADNWVKEARIGSGQVSVGGGVCDYSCALRRWMSGNGRKEGGAKVEGFRMFGCGWWKGGDGQRSW